MRAETAFPVVRKKYNVFAGQKGKKSATQARRLKRRNKMSPMMSSTNVPGQMNQPRPLL